MSDPTGPVGAPSCAAAGAAGTGTGAGAPLAPSIEEDEEEVEEDVAVPAVVPVAAAISAASAVRRASAAGGVWRYRGKVACKGGRTCAKGAHVCVQFTHFVRTSCALRTNFVRSAHEAGGPGGPGGSKGTVSLILRIAYEVRTKFVRSSYEVRTKFVRNWHPWVQTTWATSAGRVWMVQTRHAHGNSARGPGGLRAQHGEKAGGR